MSPSTPLESYIVPDFSFPQTAFPAFMHVQTCVIHSFLYTSHPLPSWLPSTSHLPHQACTWDLKSNEDEWEKVDATDAANAPSTPASSSSSTKASKGENPEEPKTSKDFEDLLEYVKIWAHSSSASSKYSFK
ncbi:hypothetical protein GWK47_015370 [Chionoecetes opilio]|uniref:Uncharacterized protein n=1 Tax=Chionoecetes opilio TaxID=41210 RepID=A0A8J5BZU3_CHIOP|nr:hypothetical protein GWK47_015370 [Chionoecetes opilio]